MHVLHGGADFGVVHQLLQHRDVATAAHELGAERLAVDVPAAARLDAQQLADGREHSVGVKTEKALSHT